MSYCIALHSDIETLKIARKVFVEKGFDDTFEFDNGVAWNDNYEQNFIHGRDFIECRPDMSIQYSNHDMMSHETITCTPDNLNETIDLIIEKLKEH